MTGLWPRQGFELVLQPPDSPPADPRESYGWLLRHLPAVPNFSHLRQGAIQGLRIACHVSRLLAAPGGGTDGHGDGGKRFG